MTLMLRSYRARYDDGSETTASWQQPLDTGWAQYPGRPFRLRFLLQRLTSSDELSSLTDDFSSAFINPFHWQGSGGVTQSGGQLSLPCASSPAGLVSTYGYDLTGQHVAVHVTGVPTDTNGGTYTALSFYVDDDNQLVVEKLGGQLHAASIVAGVVDSSDTTWNAVSMAWWRVRETSGQVFLETSPDGTTWTARKTVTTPAYATSGRARLSCGFTGTEPSPGSATMDDFNLYTGGPPSPPTTATDWQIFYSLNGGSWAPVTGSSAVVRSTLSANIVENAATTQQIGTETFIAGTVDELEGFFATTTLAVDQQTELEGCLTLVPADVHAGDSVSIIVTRANYDFLEVYNRTPTLTVVAYPVTVWNGTTEQPATVTAWDGTTEHPLLSLEVT